MITNLPINWYGGKASHLDWLLPRLPSDTDGYVEPYAGSAAVLINRESCGLEVLNDKHDQLTRFFRALRENRTEIALQVELTPYSRSEYERAVEVLEDPERCEEIDDVEFARLFVIRTSQSYAAQVEGSKSSWSRSLTPTGRKAPCLRIWDSRSEQLQAAAERIRGAIIEEKDAIEVIREYNKPETLIYCDPPYVHESRSSGGGEYRHEMTREDHRELCEVLRGCDGKVALSGYTNKIYEEELEDRGWYRVDSEPIKNHSGNDGSTRVESLWCNYDPDDV